MYNTRTAALHVYREGPRCRCGQRKRIWGEKECISISLERAYGSRGPLVVVVVVVVGGGQGLEYLVGSTGSGWQLAMVNTVDFGSGWW